MFLDASKAVFENAATLRGRMTIAEKVLWDYLKLKPLGYKFRRQHAISKYIADFYCHSLKLIIEVDGNIHDMKAVAEHDKVRQEYLESEGLSFLRFTNEQIETDVSNVIAIIEQYLEHNNK